MLYKPYVVQRGLHLGSQFSSIHIYSEFHLQEESKSTLQMRRWWKGVSLPAHLPLALYFCLCPLTCLHCIKLNWFPLSSLTLLVSSQRQGHGRPSRQGWVFFLCRDRLATDTRRWANHWERCPKFPPPCAPDCMHLCVVQKLFKDFSHCLPL